MYLLRNCRTWCTPPLDLQVRAARSRPPSYNQVSTVQQRYLIDACRHVVRWRYPLRGDRIYHAFVSTCTCEYLYLLYWMIVSCNGSCSHSCRFWDATSYFSCERPYRGNESRLPRQQRLSSALQSNTPAAKAQGRYRHWWTVCTACYHSFVWSYETVPVLLLYNKEQHDII